MRKILRSATSLAALMLANTALHAQTSAAPPPLSPTERLLMDRIDKQDAEIRALREQLENVTAILSNRMAATEAATDRGKLVMTAPSPRFESRKADFTLAIVGALQPEVAFYRQPERGSGAPILNNGTGFRRAHLGVQGTAFTDFAYQLILDGAALGGVASAVREATIAYTGLRPFTLTVGNQKPQNGLEPSISDRSNASTFLEPGLPAALATANGTRAIGLRLSTGTDHYSASLGLFGDDISNAAIATPFQEGWGVHGRLTWAPVNRPGRLVHLGASAYRRDPGTVTPTTAEPVNSQLRFRAQPEITTDATRLVDTGVLTRVDHYSYLGLESSFVRGPLALQAEYARSWVDQVPGRVGLSFTGAYVAGSLFLTGESRIYEGRTGLFSRLSPKRPFGRNTGLGAVELAARWSRLDLDSHSGSLDRGGVRGGVLTDYTLGLNWYLNPYLRLMMNYIHADADKRSAPTVDQGTGADIVAVRVHQEW